MNNEFLTTALFDNKDNYICDLLGESEHIKNQMFNIYKFKLDFATCKLCFDKTEKQLTLRTNNGLTLLIAVIQ